MIIFLDCQETKCLYCAGMIKKLWHDLTDPAHWNAALSYARSGDARGLLTQIHWFLLRQQKRKPVLKIKPNMILPAPDLWPADQPLVSVIIPCFNYGHFVREAVDSVLAQSFQDFEIILIDGGSTDGSDKIVASIQHPKIRTFLREGRHYLGDNRNFGIEQARGKYVCCLDADDLFAPDYLLKTVFLLESTNLDVVGTAKQFFGGINRIYHGPTQPVLSHLISNNPVTVSSIYAKTTWQSVGPFNDFGQGADYIFEDWEFWFRVAAHGARFYMIAGEALFQHRVHGISMSRNDTIKPRRSHASFITERNAAVLNDQTVRISKQHRKQIYRRQDPLRNLLRYPLNRNATTAAEMDRFLPVALQADFVQFLQAAPRSHS